MKGVDYDHSNEPKCTYVHHDADSHYEKNDHHCIYNLNAGCVRFCKGLHDKNLSGPCMGTLFVIYLFFKNEILQITIPYNRVVKEYHLFLQQSPVVLMEQDSWTFIPA